MKDERENLPSASSFEIVAMCPGQPQLKAQLPPNQMDLPDEDAQMGLRIHLAREIKSGINLTQEESDIFERGLANEGRIFQEWATSFDVQASQEHNEIRLWLDWPDGSHATSSRLDVHYASMDHVLVCEWKTLWCKNLTPAERNWQGRVQAVVAAKQYGVKHVRVAFNKAMFGRSDVVDYNENDLINAESSIFARLWEAKQEGARRNPGGWCNHCVCKAYCAEAQAYSLLPSVMAAQAVDNVQNMPIADVVKLFQSDLIVRKILEAAKKRLKALPAEELKELGLMLDNGKNQDPIVNTIGAYKFLEHKLPQDAIWKALNFSKGNLVGALQENCMMTKKEAELWIARELYIFIEKKRTEGSLVEINP